jgi:hypothetical protein
VSPEAKPFDAKRGRTVAAIFLIAAGVVLFFLQSRIGLGQSGFFFIAGVVFVAAYLYSGSYGYLIPGCLLAGLGIDNLVEVPYGLQFHEWSPAGLGLGFVLIFVVDYLYGRQSRWWPLIPGGVLIIMGMSAAGFGLSWALSLVGPAALILIGLGVLFGWIGRRREEDAPSGPDETGPSQP